MSVLRKILYIKRKAQIKQPSLCYFSEANEAKDDLVINNARRGSRRAAAQAVGSLKEAPTNKKLRQGDPLSTSIYKDHRLSNIREFSVPKPKTNVKSGRKK